ncbi:MAG: hypothetical protein R6X02_33375 [Enhygromyxa sp.]
MSVAFGSPRHKLVLAGLLASLGLGVPGCKHQAPLVAAAEALTAHEIPAWTNEGPGREVEVLLESPGLKIAAIALRRGTELPVHSVESRISITVLQGAGLMTVEDQSFALEPGAVVVLEPSVAHAMTPADEQLVVLLVHHFTTPS